MPQNHQESLQKNEISQQELIQQNKEYSTLLHKYEQETDDHRHQMNTSKSYIERLIIMTEKCRTERDLAVEQTQKIQQELYKTKQDYELYMESSNSQLEELMEK
jgi:DNA-binding protein H-NS